jgi:regulatory protein YycI of two-component signal transduction system YycFG
MKKSLLLVSLILVLTLSSTGCKKESSINHINEITLDNEENLKSDNVEIKKSAILPPNCSVLHEKINRDFCNIDKAKDKGDHIYCEEIEDSNRKDNCLRTVAIKNKDKKLCNQIGNITNKNYCFQDVFYLLKK